MDDGDIMADLNYYFIVVAAADKDAALAAVRNVTGDGQWTYLDTSFEDAIPLILDDDPDDQPARAWLLMVAQYPRVAQLIKASLDFAGVTYRYREVPAQLWLAWSDNAAANEYHLLDCWLADHPVEDNQFRRRECLMPSIGTGLADGTADAQATTTTPIVVQQWTTVHRLIRMSHSGGFAFSDFPAGTYEFEIGNKYGGPLHFEPVENITFGFRAAVHNGSLWQQVGAEATSDDGSVKGMISGVLGAGYMVALSVRSSEPATFKLSVGSGMELRRVAK